MEAKTLFGKYPLDIEREKFRKILDKAIEVYPNVAYPFLLFNRDGTVKALREIKEELSEVGV
jgi:hypothetical protein